MVGISSDTVGCIATVLVRSEILDPAYIKASTSWIASSPPGPMTVAPNILLVSASTIMRISPRVSPFSLALATFVIGRMPTRTRLPSCFASASVKPTRPKGGSK
jgi:hypothetical protein